MKSKVKVLLIMMISAVVLIAGISVAYYNTYSMIYEEEPVIVSVGGGEYSFLDFKIKNKDIKLIKEKIEKAFPNGSINM
ncbi:MAG: hypothetical protein PUE60_00470 [Eubacteriales bacterium]|nr:hypothetical protein [Eubacteriales bacterium]